MVNIRPMTPADAEILQKLMEAEALSYLRHFTSFAEPGSLARQRSAARHDGFFTLLNDDRPMGFFCLRGLDQGYIRPSFGVYITSDEQGRGAARAALWAAQLWCRERELPVLMLKVAPDNTRASVLYEADGFVVVGQCPKSGHTIMEKRID